MKRFAATLGGIMLVLAVPAVLAQGTLDGKKYLGEIGDAGQAADEKDVVFTFVDGTFHSSVCKKYGYERGAYTTTKDGDSIQFEARTVSAKYGTNAWRGTVKDGRLEGVLMWHRKPSFFNRNPAPVEMWFRARLM